MPVSWHEQNRPYVEKLVADLLQATAHARLRLHNEHVVTLLLEQLCRHQPRYASANDNHITVLLLLRHECYWVPCSQGPGWDRRRR